MHRREVLKRRPRCRVDQGRWVELGGWLPPALLGHGATKAAGAPAVATSAAPCGQAHILGKRRFSLQRGVWRRHGCPTPKWIPRQCHRADIDEIERRCRDEGGDFGLRLQATQLKLNIRVSSHPVAG